MALALIPLPLQVVPAEQREGERVKNVPLRNDRLRREHEDGPESKPAAGMLPVAPPPRSLYDAYEKIGVWNGPYSSRDGAAAEIEFWRSRGLMGLFYLIGRVRRESDTQTLNTVAAVMSELGPARLPVLLRNLEFRPSPRQAFCLLLAIGWMSGKATGAVGKRTAGVIARYLQHPDSDVREAAAAASQILQPQNAIGVLRLAATSETDPIVLAAINEAIEAHEAQ